MRIKTVGGRRRTPITQDDDEHNTTVYDSEYENQDYNPQHIINHPHELQPEPIELLDENICICCSNKHHGGDLLVCSENGCPISIHVSCIGSEPKFDASRNFYCPYCWYKRALNECRELKEKAKIAKKALSSFLDKNQTVPLDVDDDNEKEPEPEFHEHVNPVQDDDEPNVMETRDDVDSVSQTKDSDSDAITVKKDHAKPKVVSEKKPVLREHNGDDVDQEVNSSRSLKQPQSTKRTTLLTGKRKRLNWTDEEEKVLKEGVLKFSVENQNIPWRRILEFGCRVFDKTRTPVDLKDKWKNITFKEGSK